ncbi:uncharacterized protein LOC126237173 isoform X4 [Schistocerca nitens]|uniref:uncharacterized protein LOC126237173 isoform X4 n=1 Tax=Schistocerca nitens TaxID=7011 RepID=UPI002117FC49|nr:uncharacterized protein LOC126237173 isoform X4 [Schistocerca nitens]
MPRLPALPLACHWRHTTDCRFRVCRRLRKMGQAAPERKAGGKRARCWLWLGLAFTAALLYLASVAPTAYHRHILPGMVAVESEEERRLAAQSSAASFAVDTAGCRIPALQAWDPQVRRFVEPPPHIDCGRPRLVTSDDARLYIRRERLRWYNVSSDFGCCYRRFWRSDGDPKHYSHGVDDAITMAEECVPFESGTDVSGEEFVKVECRSPTNGSVVFRDYHAFVPLKPRVEERVVNLTDVGDDDESFSERPSVLIVGIDAVSRLNFHRQMNGTLAELRRLGAIEMLGYNKVGDNTFPNLVPVLAGMSEAELRNACWPNDKVAFDDCPWLWKTFHAAGYRSAFGEDAPWMGIFSYLKVGFVLQPTDYYLRPYMKLSEDDVGHKKPMNAKLCTGSRLTAEVLLEYVGRLGRALLTCRRRVWALFWGASLSHDILSYPAAGDRLYVRLLRDLERCGALNRTIVVVMSDHGIRWGAIRETYQGRLEERLPMLSVLLPAGFQQRYPAAAANLRRNARRLSTPFDLHRTLLDVAHAPRGLDADSLRVRSRAAAEAAASADSSQQAARGLSLFTELPAARTCASAGVEPHWCTCQESRPVSTDSQEAVRAATFVVTQLNLLLGSHRECARLTLAEVRDARLLVARKSQLDGADGAHAAPVDVLVTLRTSPGDAVFEATVRRRPHEGDMALAGVVSRLNQYGKQSACMTNFRLRLYCYCRTS